MSSAFKGLTGLVVGLGSIGERHAANLLALGVERVIACRSRDRAPRLVDLSTIEVVYSLDEALSLRPDFAVICTPTSLHYHQASACLASGVPVLIEKPATQTRNELEALRDTAERADTFWSVGYMMRFHPLLQDVYGIQAAGTYGKLRMLSTHWGEYLPDWHPWEDYRESYAARRELGGGAHLTLSHDIDVAGWFLGGVVDVNVHRSYESNLEVDVDVAAVIGMRSSEGAIASTSLNIFQRKASRTYNFVYDEATIHLDYYASAITIDTISSIKTTRLTDFARNNMFLDQSKDFLENLSDSKDRKALRDQAYDRANLVQRTIDQYNRQT